MTHALTLRPITDADLPFLRQVYGSTRAEELALIDWGDVQKAAFIQQQFDAQHRYYQQNYAGAQFQIIEWVGQPVGRLYLVEWPDEVRIIDIALLPEYRGRGFGSQLLGGVLAWGARLNKPVTIHVERFNPALRWYERLGFKQVEDKGVYLLLKWTPPAP